MSETSGPILSVNALFAEHNARRQRERDAEVQLKRKREEELADFKKRLDNFQLTDAHIEAVIRRIKRAFERGENELMLTSFPSSFCSDGGRAVNNADAPQINKPDITEPGEPEWLETLPAGARPIYNFWKSNLQPGGFLFSARIINYPGGKPGDVGLFFSWPKSTLESQP
jgi:hypothetical protein